MRACLKFIVSVLCQEETFPLCPGLGFPSFGMKKKSHWVKKRRSQTTPAYRAEVELWICGGLFVHIKVKPVQGLRSIPCTVHPILFAT